MAKPLDSDDEILEQLGYKQQLRRAVGFFSMFAISSSVISITTGMCKVACSVREGRARIASHCFNNADDVDRLIATLP